MSNAVSNAMMKKYGAAKIREGGEDLDRDLSLTDRRCMLKKKLVSSV
jgi:hypothetical protein